MLIQANLIRGSNMDKLVPDTLPFGKTMMSSLQVQSNLHETISHKHSNSPLHKVYSLLARRFWEGTSPPFLCRFLQVYKELLQSVMPLHLLTQTQAQHGSTCISDILASLVCSGSSGGVLYIHNIQSMVCCTSVLQDVDIIEVAAGWFSNSIWLHETEKEELLTLLGSAKFKCCFFSAITCFILHLA